MPISNPSYFPPSRANGSIVGITAGEIFTGARSFLAGANAGNFTDCNDIIVIGDNALKSLGNATPSMDGVIAIGSQSLQNLQPQAAIGGGRVTALGSFAGQQLLFGSGNVLIGDGCFQNCVGDSAHQSVSNVMIGSNCAQNAGVAGINPFVRQCVLIGNQVLQGVDVPGGGATATACVIIGSAAANNLGSSHALANCVIIGTLAGTGNLAAAGGNNVVLIGANSDGPLGTAAGFDVIIGSSATCGAGNAVIIGDNAAAAGGQFVIAIGDHANTHGGTQSVLIGSNVGKNLVAPNHLLLIESGDAGPQDNKTLIRGSFGTQNVFTDGGTLILGGSRPGVDDDMVGFQTVKLLNGTAGGVNPVGGGYFYVTGGVVHWVDSAGTDSQISLSAAGQLASQALVAYTNNAGASAGTLTNAPAVGNPTKWIPINDNGTIRNIPAW